MPVQDKQLAPPDGWLSAGTVRVAPLGPQETGLFVRLFIRIAGVVAKIQPSNVFLVLMRNGRLFRPWLWFASQLMPYGTLDRRDTELAILRVAWNCRCRYEWGQHVDMALRSGVTAQEVVRVTAGPDAPGWTPRHSALLRAADEIHCNRLIADTTWKQLTEHYNQKKLIEVCMLIGHYEMLAGVLISAGVPLERPLEDILARAPIHN